MPFLFVVRRLRAGMVPVALTILVTSANDTTTIAQEATLGSRVRSEDRRIAAAIAEGIDTSTTFRRLVESIDATDGVVYVQEGKCGRGVRACLLLFVGVAGPYRFLRILINPRKAPGCELIPSIGHELQHALEVLGNPKIKSTLDMFAFFDQKGPTGWRDTFETDEALRAGMLVDRETCKGSLP
jgi:hypothetical protein